MAGAGAAAQRFRVEDQISSASQMGGLATEPLPPGGSP
eukprot:CAMPEP_0174294724 /NCGR_PEP_ID=MMETSP0809-20121228/42463_1 /TAXON_ID=73025 ORGANISM="Eutreptiella gymnastica-like, Strain CCMP1594" /NCGR_SAMPLE_ID=MMETSP0809 /ASSEMBLY_ACC=CAM_ASM_000658 /LENGTH=37 /DNA_ID= /DNA_START= /DNA_END= /DNA_ORIENTATION=